MPAPPEGSEPAMVRTAGAAIVDDMRNGLSRPVSEDSGVIRRIDVEDGWRGCVIGIVCEGDLR